MNSGANIISNNYFFDNTNAIYIYDYSHSNSIISNHIDNPVDHLFRQYDVTGIYLNGGGSYISDTCIEKNLITHCKIGIIVDTSYYSNICMNTFIENIVHARFSQTDTSYWNGNYWGRPRILPKLIFGVSDIDKILPRFIEFDWHPAKEPYLI